MNRFTHSSTHKKFIVIKNSDVRGGGREFWRHMDNPGKTGKGGLKITILVGRPLWMPPYIISHSKMYWMVAAKPIQANKLITYFRWLVLWKLWNFVIAYEEISLARCICDQNVCIWSWLWQRWMWNCSFFVLYKGSIWGRINLFFGFTCKIT